MPSGVYEDVGHCKRALPPLLRGRRKQLEPYVIWDITGMRVPAGRRRCGAVDVKNVGHQHFTIGKKMESWRKG